MNINNVFIALFYLLSFSFFQKRQDVKSNKNAITWTNLSLSYLELKIKSTDNFALRKIYKNRLISLKAQNSNNSLYYRRSMLLKQISSSRTLGSKFYILEVNSTGEEIEFNAHVISENKAKILITDTYQYKQGKWNKIISYSEKIKEPDFRKFHVKFGSGFNDSDIMITFFLNNLPKYSEYYLYTTLLKDRYLEKILAPNL